MKIKYMAMLAVAALMTACSGGNTKEAEAVDAAEAEAAQAESPTVAEPAASGVVLLQDDETLRPGKALDKVTIIDFNASWCVPCKKFAPTFDEAAAKYTDVNFMSVDIDQCSLTAQAFDVSVVPTVVILNKDGKEVQRYTGTSDLLPSEKFFEIVAANK